MSYLPIRPQFQIASAHLPAHVRSLSVPPAPLRGLYLARSSEELAAQARRCSCRSHFSRSAIQTTGLRSATRSSPDTGSYERKSDVSQQNDTRSWHSLSVSVVSRRRTTAIERCLREAVSIGAWLRICGAVAPPYNTNGTSRKRVRR